MCLLSLPLPPALPSTQPIDSGGNLRQHPCYRDGLRRMACVPPISHITPQRWPAAPPGSLGCAHSAAAGKPARTAARSRRAACRAGLCPCRAENVKSCALFGRLTSAWHLGDADRSYSTLMKATTAFTNVSLALSRQAPMKRLSCLAWLLLHSRCDSQQSLCFITTRMQSAAIDFPDSDAAACT